ncbi:hypothetical protein FS837_005165 [Tulasnella sp. UAMH 9824]|nr:hypothetical protein FS837_005165 [Tulasnella sp. UAMH 9824]
MSAGPESNNAGQFFSPEKRVSFDRLDATFSSLDQPCTSDAFIEGDVSMEWAFNANNQNQRFQLTETGDGFVVPKSPSTLEVVFVSDALEKQRFIRKKMRLALAGGVLEWTGGKAKKRPKLTFAKGIRLQKLDEKGKQVIETFDLLPTPSDTQQRQEDWYRTPGPSSPPTVEVERPDSDAEKKRKRSTTPEPALEPAPSTLDFNEIPAEEDLDMGVSGADDGHADAGRDASTRSGSSASTDTDNRRTRTASTEILNSGSHSHSSKPSTVHAEPPKKKPRMSSSGQKKSQPNLRAISQNSGTESRSGSVVSSTSVPEGKHRKKNAKKRQKEKERKAMEKAQKAGTGEVPTVVGSVTEMSPPPPPPPPTRDPALDLLPGYKCTERTPTEYLAIADLKKNLQRKVCFVGIVVQMDTPMRVGNQGDWSMGLSVVDSSFGEYSQPFLVNLYAKGDEGSRLPAIQIGQPLLLRQVKVTEKPPGTLRGVGFKDSFQWVGYDSLADTASYGSQPRADAPALAGRWKATKADLTYFKSISRWWDVAGEGIMRDLGIRYTPKESQIMPTPHLDVLASQPVELGLVKIKDIPIQVDVPHHSVTVDLIVEVTRCWVHQYASNRVDIFVTDYTFHPNLKPDHQKPHFPYALKISAWDKVGADAAVLNTGYYLFKKVPIKLDKEGYLEGKINDPKENLIQKLSSQHSTVQQLLEWEKSVIDGTANENSTMLDAEELQELNEDQPTTKLVHNEHLNAPFSRIEDVLQTTSLPNKFRVAVQIVDYKPRKLREWVRGYCERCKEELKKECEKCINCGDDEGRHLRKFYRFAFKVRNKAGAEMVITASENEAQNFLKEIPCDYINSVTSLRSFIRYLQPILPPSEEGEDQQTDAPLIDICVAVTASERYGRTYHLFGCQLMKEDDAVMKD